MLLKCARNRIAIQAVLFSTRATSVPPIQEIIDKRINCAIPEKFNFARDVIDYWAEKERRQEKSSSHPALRVIGVDGKEFRQINYTELSQLSKQLAGGFIDELGLTRKDRIFVCVPRCPEFWIATIAALRAGIEFTTVTAQALPRDLQYRIRQFKPTVVITDKIEDIAAAEYADWPVRVLLCVNRKPPSTKWRQLSSLLNKTSFEAADTLAKDEALVYFTSGTTGSPKMVQHTHSYTLGHMTTLTNLLMLDSSDDFLCTADTGWAKTAFGTYPVFLAGAGLVVDLETRFDPRRLVHLLETLPISRISSAPTVYRMMMNQRDTPFNFPHLKGVGSGGEALSAEAFNKWRKLTGIEIREGYAQSETLLICSSDPELPAKPGSMGVATPEFQLEVLDDNLQPVSKPNEPGELALRIKPDHPVGLFTGYKDEPEKTKKAFQGDYYLTGDKVRKDEDGYFWFDTRVDDVINSAGYRIGPYEIETVINEHPDVLECAVVGAPDPERVEIVKAFIVLNNPDKASDKLKQEIQDFVKQRTAPYKYPRKVEFRASLPKTISNKVQRHLLRKEESKSS